MSDSKWIDVGEIDKLIGKLERFDTTLCSLDRKEQEECTTIHEELEKLGISFSCSDFGDDYCLSSKGAILVLEAVKKMGKPRWELMKNAI